MEFTIALFVLISVLAFCCEFIDSSFGGGYGTILSPVFLILGFDLLLIVPSILLSELFSGFSSCIFHHKQDNVNFRDIEEKSLKIGLLIGTLGVISTVITMFIVFSMSKFYIKLYIGILVVVIGLLILARFTYKFSWKKIAFFGSLGAFNKTISGGGYGPLITAGQVISGQKTKISIATTQFCEGMVCLSGIICYAIFMGSVNLIFPLFLIIGALPATPLASKFVKEVKNEKLLKRLLGLVCVSLGSISLIKLFLW